MRSSYTASCLVLALPHALSYGVPMAARPAARAAAVRAARAPYAFMQMAGDAPKVVSEETYGMMLSTLLKTEKSVAAEISANYAMVDYTFLQRLYAPSAPHGK